MKSREELIEQHNRLLSAYEKVKDLLSSYPNVVKIGIGVKEKDGKLTDEGCIKIIVKEKKSEAELGIDKVIPKVIDGVTTDIVLYQDKILEATCAEDQDSYRPIRGGIMINNVRNGGNEGGSGTLGCVAQLNSDNSWVILSNHHVLYGDSGQDNDEIGQPWVGCSWCCKTNVVAKNVNKNTTLDCAIAKINSDIAVNNIIEEIGNIGGLGAVAAVNGERVRKRGARTGYTSGTISFIDVTTGEITVTANPAGGPTNDPGGCTNYRLGETVFSFPGDSGSVYLNDNNEVVGLHYAGSSGPPRSYGNDIIRIQAALAITVKTTSSTPGRAGEIYIVNKNDEKVVLSQNNDWTEKFEVELERTHTGRTILHIFRKHEVELFRLINKHRPVTLTWQRKQGPAFIAAFGRSVKYSDYIIPNEINRVSMQNLLMSMASILEEHGSDSLRLDIQQYSLDVLQLSKGCHSANDFLKIMQELDKKEVVS